MSHNFCSDVHEVSSLLQESEKSWGGDKESSKPSLLEGKRPVKDKKVITEGKDEKFLVEDADDRRANDLLKMFDKKIDISKVVKSVSGEPEEISIKNVSFSYGNRELSAYDEKTSKTYVWAVNNTSGRGDEYSLDDVIKEAYSIDKDGDAILEQFEGLELSPNEEVICENIALREILAEGVSTKVLNQYLATALWSSTDDDGGNLDDDKEVGDIDKSSVRKSKKDLDKFFKMAGDLLDGEDETTVAHDFWLTRNGHGAGFWDGDYEKEKGKALTKIAEKFKEVYAYIGDDGKVYLD